MSRRIRRKLKRILLLPFNALVNLLSALKDLWDMFLAMTGLKVRRRHRRNKDFERAGRERRPAKLIDVGAVANLEKANRQRDLEILAQVRRENRVLKRNDNESEELRREMEEDNLSFSQGAAINHLAEMNRKAAEKKKRARQQEAQDQESNPADK